MPTRVKKISRDYRYFPAIERERSTEVTSKYVDDAHSNSRLSRPF